MNILIDLKPGDHLLYFENSIVDWVIAVKTWTIGASHIEVFDGATGRPPMFQRMSLASRNGIGVGRYPFRRDGLTYVLRPKVWDHAAATEWFKTVDGEAYDWVGLLCFSLAVKQGSLNKMFCSEFAKRMDDRAGCPSFSAWWDADRTPPSLTLSSPAFDMMWVKNGNVNDLVKTRLTH